MIDLWLIIAILAFIDFGIIYSSIWVEGTTRTKVAKAIKRAKEEMNKEDRGIVTIIGLIMFVVLLILLAEFSPIIAKALNTTSTYFTDPITKMVINLIPAMMILGVVISYLIYAGAGR